MYVMGYGFIIDCFHVKETSVKKIKIFTLDKS